MYDASPRLDPGVIQAVMKRAHRERSEYIGGLIVGFASHVGNLAGDPGLRRRIAGFVGITLLVALAAFAPY